ncbi:MAG TPA: hypothetical protein EYO33_19980 [Phycisphaerales bacterium]|nr:hypothetical protein [Phycisphaerales bacterium]
MASQKPHHVVFCCSGRSGLVFLAVAARSLLETHSRPERVRVHVIFEHLTQADLDSLLASWQPWSDRGQIFFHQLSDVLGEKALERGYGYWFRAWMHLVLPPDVERVLYLDYDLLVLEDVSPLWHIDVSGRLGAMVVEPDSSRGVEELYKVATNVGLAYDPSQPYFNSGVIFVNLNRWRDVNMGKILDEVFAAHRPHDYLNDQGEINLLFSAEFLPLPARYNVIRAPNYNLLHRRKLKSETLNPVILHFAGPEKVTRRWRRLGEKRAFYTVLDRTAWRGFRSENDKSLLGILISQLLEYRFLLNNRDSLPNFRRRFAALLLRNPTLPLLQLFLAQKRFLQSLANMTVRGTKSFLGEQDCAE